MPITPTAIWPVAAQLGEGPMWHPSEQALYFVDIKQGMLHRHTPAGNQSWPVGGAPSFVVPTSDGRLIVGSRTALRIGRGDDWADLASIPMPAHNRTNDATVDASGRLWLGTMDDNEELETGAIWCLASGQLAQAGGKAVVTNGPAVSPCGRWLYHVDSGQRRIWRCPLPAADAPPVLAAGELFLQLPPEDGHPDGVIVDAEGCLWVGLWDGWGVRRYAPSGEMLLHVPLPCARATKLALGGPDGTTAYVTTARVGLSPQALESQPLAGALFTFEAPAPGLPLPAVMLG
ncbi:MAG TPA: SMP-30/gluconolactonase/LRE family protein [Novosphingobium sp.]|nr:SMP-30/gluconolactonase/LRE family protein [Novosphingobium sp.]